MGVIEGRCLCGGKLNIFLAENAFFSMYIAECPACKWYMDGESINYSSLEHFKLDVTRYLATRFKLEKPLNASGIKKVVINTCFGGYGLSEKVVLKFNEESGTKMSATEASYKIPRDNDLLIRIIEEVGVENAGGLCADLKIIEIPDDIEFVISEYDGKETLHEKHRTWC